MMRFAEKMKLISFFVPQRGLGVFHSALILKPKMEELEAFEEDRID
jgi:hypothetical protein